MSHGGFAQLRDEAAMVETSSLWPRLLEGIGYLDSFPVVDHVVALDLDGINLF